MANRTINFFQRLRAALMKASGTENTVLRVRAVQTDGKRYNPVNHGVSMKKLDESPYMVNLLKPHPTENNAFELLIDADTLIESLEDAGLYDTVAANFRVSGNDLVYDRVKPDGTIIQAGVTISGLFSAESDTLYGSGVPDNGTGNDGDEYLDTTSGIIYQKESGAWVVKKDLNTLDNQIASEVPFDPAGTAFDSGSTDVDKALKEAGDRVHDLEAFETSATAELSDHDTRIQTEEAISLDHETRISANEAVAHSHANKALLDTYTQTEADLADAVNKKHTHLNAAALDSVSNSESVDKYLSGTTEYVPIHMTLTELRAYTGNATRCVVHYNGTAGIAVRDVSVTTDNIGTQWIDGNGNGWKRIFNEITPEYFGSSSNGIDNDYSALQSVFNYAQSIAIVKNSRIKVILRNKYAFQSPLNIPYLIDIDMIGGQLIYTGTDKSVTAVSIGTNGQTSINPTHIGLNISGPALNTISVSEEEAYIGVRFFEMLYGYVTFKSIQSFSIGVQLLPSPGKAISYNQFYGINPSVCKIGLDLRGGASSAYVNENSFYSSNFTLSSSAYKLGRLCGVRFSSEPSGYTGQNNNRFYGSCFQVPGLGSGSDDYSWSPGKSVSINYRYYNLANNYEYIVTDLGTSGGISGSNAPTDTTIGNTFIDNNSVTWTTVGKFFRVPIFHDNAGSFNLFYGSRWESGYGPFAMINGSSIQGNNYQIYKEDTNEYASNVIDTITFASTCNSNSSLINKWKTYQKERINTQNVFDLKSRFILGSRLVSNGMFLSRFNVTSIYRTSTSFTHIVKILKDGVYLTCSTTAYVSLLFKCNKYKSIKFSRVSPYDRGRFFVRGLDKNLVTKEIASSSDIDSVLSDASTFDATGDWVYTSSDNARSIVAVLTGADVGMISFSYNDIVIRDLIIEAINPDTEFQLFSPYEPFDVRQRSSYGSPVVGIFQQHNEVIGDLSGGNGWRVTNTGIKCEPWAESGSVTFDNLTDLFTKSSHGYFNGLKVFLKGSTPSGYSNRNYFVINATTDTFQLAATLAGSAVNGTTDGSSLEISVLLLAGEYKSNAGKIYAYNYDKPFKQGDVVFIGDYVVTFPQNTTSANLIYQVSAKDKQHLRMGSTIPVHTSGSLKIDGITYDFIGYSEITGVAPTHSSGVVGDWEYICNEAILTSL